MKPGSIMLSICIFVIGLLFAISQPSEKRFMYMVSSEVVQIIKTNINILRDKLRGVEPFYVEAGEDDTLFEDDPFGEYNLLEVEEIGEDGIFEADDSVEADVEWDDK